MVLIMIARCPSAMTTRKLEKKNVYYLDNLIITQHSQDHPARMQADKEQAGSASQGSAFTGVKGGDPGFYGLALHW